jgi:uncharacterized SAM-binding protein YcdF (DUF218 family)
MWILSLPTVSDPLMAGLESGLSLPRDPDGDVIVVLCAGALPVAPDLAGIGRPTEGTIVRLATAARLYRIHPAPIIVSGGKPLYPGPSEAELAGRLLTELGLPPSAILEEKRSRDTWENAVHTARICRSRGWTRPLLVTHGYHMKRAESAFRRQGLSVTPVPVSLHPATSPDRIWTDWLPGDFRELSDGLHEVMGRLFYRWAHRTES